MSWKKEMLQEQRLTNERLTNVENDIKYHIKRTDLLETSHDRYSLFMRWFIPVMMTLVGVILTILGSKFI